MRFADGGHLALVDVARQLFVEGVRSGERSTVPEVGCGELIGRRELVVGVDGEVVLAGAEGVGERIGPSIAGPRGVSGWQRRQIRQWIERDVGLNGGADGDLGMAGAGGPYAHVPHACIGRWYGAAGALAVEPAQALVIAEEEGAILDDGAAERSSELIAAQRGNLGRIELVAGVECAVAEELVGVAVELVAAGTRDCVDDSAGGLAVVGGGVAGDDGEFLNGVDAEVAADDAARAAVGVVIDADA